MPKSHAPKAPRPIIFNGSKSSTHIFLVPSLPTPPVDIVAAPLTVAPDSSPVALGIFRPEDVAARARNSNSRVNASTSGTTAPVGDPFVVVAFEDRPVALRNARENHPFDGMIQPTQTRNRGTQHQVFRDCEPRRSHPPRAAAPARVRSNAYHVIVSRDFSPHTRVASRLTRRMTINRTRVAL
jgi:hypothetical protein